MQLKLLKDEGPYAYKIAVETATGDELIEGVTSVMVSGPARHEDFPPQSVSIEVRFAALICDIDFAGGEHHEP